MFNYDASPWTDEEMDLLAAENAEALGWEGMETYEDEAVSPSSPHPPSAPVP
jgi:hypothetical protein